MATHKKQRDLPVFDIPLSAWDERDRSNGITYQGRDYGKLLDACNERKMPHAWDNQFFLNEEIAQAFLDQFSPATPSPVVASKPSIDPAELRAALEKLLLAIGTN